MSHPTIASAMETAWSNSKEGTPEEHIEGFTIYQCYDAHAVDGDVFKTQIEWGSGTASSITYPANRQNSQCRLVGNFHTHPGVGTSHPQSNDPYESDRPSPSEQKTDLPGIIRYGLGPISGEGKTVDITFGPNVSSTLSWTCDAIAVASDNTGNNADSDGAVSQALQPVSYTDPHLITLDGLAYSFQAIGEFVLAQSELDGFVIQVRQSQSGLVNSQVSVNSGLAFKLGSDEVSIAFNAGDELQIFINHEEQSQQGDIALPDGGQLRIEAQTITLNWKDGSTAVVYIRSNFLNLSLAVADIHMGRLSGLLGNFDDKYNNDMRTRLGVDISTTPQADQLYGLFADGWRVTDQTSLFVHSSAQSTASFTNRLFPGRLFSVDDLSDSARSSATTVCRNAGITTALLHDNCVLDVGATNNIEFAEAIKQVQTDLALSAIDIVELSVQGQLEIPDVSCSNQTLIDEDGATVPNVSGAFIGTLTNPDLNINWDTQLNIEQCGASVNGLLSLGSADGLSIRRRFEGKWRYGQLRLSLAFPYSFTLDVGQAACVDMNAQLTGDTKRLEGDWHSSNCLAGGLISVSRE